MSYHNLVMISKCFNEIDSHPSPQVYLRCAYPNTKTRSTTPIWINLGEVLPDC